MFTFVNRNKVENRIFREDTHMENMEMKDRIAHIIRAKNLTAAEFALRLGIQPSNISHLLAGRNNPSLDFVRKLKETFPEYSLEWIIFGKGPITVSDFFGAQREASTLEEAVVEKPVEPIEKSQDGLLFEQATDMQSPRVPPLASTSGSLKRIILVYADNTFEVLEHR